MAEFGHHTYCDEHGEEEVATWFMGGERAAYGRDGEAADRLLAAVRGRGYEVSLSEVAGGFKVGVGHPNEQPCVRFEDPYPTRAMAILAAAVACKYNVGARSRDRWNARERQAERS